MMKSVLYLAGAVLLLATLPACQSDGPIEDAGEAIDEVGEDIADVFD